MRLARAATVVAFIASSAAAVSGQLVGTKHDFSGRNAGTNQRSGTAVQTGLCTFCHTPHKAQQTRMLWNHTYSGVQSYSWTQVTQTSGGTPLPTIERSWSGPSVLCLSCHDGTVDVGDIAWFNRRSWTGGSALDNANAPRVVEADMDMGRFHPLTTPYPFLQARNTYHGVTTGAGVNLSKYKSNPTTNKIRLFNDASGAVVAGPIAGRTGMECTSCHAVHNESGIVEDQRLLRGSRNSGDSNYICSKCHVDVMNGGMYPM